MVTVMATVTMMYDTILHNFIWSVLLYPTDYTYLYIHMYGVEYQHIPYPYFID